MWKVMIADDECFIREGLVKLIPWEELECEMVYAGKNGQEVIDHLQEYKPDIVIVDIKMPKVTGLEVAKYLKEHYPQILVIVLTAYADFEYAQKAIQCNVSDYITKTSVLEDIPKAIKRGVLKLKKRKEEEVPKLEGLFLRTLIDESYYFDNLSPDFESYYNEYQEIFSEFYLVLIHIVKGNEEIRAQMKERVLQLIELTLKGRKFRCVPVSQSEFCILVSGKEQSKDEVVKCCEDLKGVCESFLSIDIVIGLSPLQKGIEQVSRVYKETLDYIMNHFMRGNEEVLYAIREVTGPKCDNLTILLEELIEKLESGNEGEWEKALKDFMNAAYKVELISAKSAFIVLLAACRKIYRNMGRDLDNELFCNINVDAEILKATYLKNCEYLFSDIMKEMMKVIQSESGENLFDQVNRYIEEHYCSRITLSDIAEAVHANGSYVSRLYKQNTGKNLFDVINMKKVDKAKSYIIKQNLKMHEIALLVGFEDTAYFSRVFKKYTGLSPKEFEKKGEEK